MQEYTLQKRKEIVRRYAEKVFLNGTQFEQLEFLRYYQEKRNKHWDFQQLLECIEPTKKPLDNIDTMEQSIRNIIKLNKEISWKN